MSQATITARVDAKDKAAFDAFCASVGLNTSIAVNLFIKTVLRGNRIPFEIAADVPNEETLAAMSEYDEMKAHPESYKRYSSFKAAMDEVLADA